MEAETANVEASLEEFGWPLPPQCEPIAQKMASGLTFYPKKLDYNPVYINKLGEFRLEEAIENGKPISIKQLSLNTFTIAFLMSNLDKAEEIKARQVGPAFNTYVNKYYGHIHPTFRDPIASSRAQSHSDLQDLLRRTRDEIKGLVKGGSIENNGNIISLSSGQNRSNELQDGESQGTPQTTAGAIDSLISGGSSIKPQGEAEVRVSHDGSTRTVRDNHSALEPHVSSAVELPIASGSATSQAGTPTNPTAEESRETVNGTADVRLSLSAAEPPETRTPDGNCSVPLAEGSAAALGLDEDENASLRRYFPITEHIVDLPSCLSCAGNNHRTVDCQELNCAVCGVMGEHTTVGCPQNQRCDKCRQRGHESSECTSKLRASKDEMPGCDICNSRDHIESDCHFIWRSFRRKPEEMRKVRDILVYCYCCGNSGHYGGDCGLRRGSILSGGVTWSNSNLITYLDSNSSSQTLSASFEHKNPAKHRNGFAIRGKGGRPHERGREAIVLDDSEDDTETFLRPRINNPPSKRGRIQFAEQTWSSNAGRNDQSRWPQPTSYHSRDDVARYNRERSPLRYNDTRNYQPRTRDINYNSQPHRVPPARTYGWAASEEQNQRYAAPQPTSTMARGDDGGPARGKRNRGGKRTRKNKAERSRVAPAGR